MITPSPLDIFTKSNYYVNKYYSTDLNTTLYLRTDGEVRKIISEKINKLIAHDMVHWETFVSSVAEMYPMYAVRDQSYLQFPNFQLCLEMSEKSFEGLYIRRYCTIVFSLLCPFFTVYFEDNIRRNTGDYVVDLSIYHATSMDDETKHTEMMYLAIVERVRQHYPDYEFVNHLTLFLNGAEVYNGYAKYWDEPVKKHYSYFELLFNQFNNNTSYNAIG